MNVQKQQSKDLISGMEQAFFLLKKTEKLSSAVYLVSSLISDNEPIKWRLREKNLELLSDMTFLRTAKLSDRIEFLNIISNKILEIISLIEIALSGALISDMNAKILVGEYKSLERRLHGSVIQDGYPRTVLTELFDGIEKTQEEKTYEASRKQSHDDLKDSNFKGQQAYNSVLYNQDKGHRNKAMETGLKRLAGSIKKDTHSHKVKTLAVNKAIKDSRKEKIIATVKKKGQVTIKDISAVISGCSNKTLQRELLSLVKDNVLKKEGERRWSRYSLASG